MSKDRHITQECEVNSSSLGTIYKRFLMQRKDKKVAAAARAE